MKYLKYIFLTLYSQSIFGFSITSTPSRVSISVELEKPIVQESIKEGEYFTVLSIPGAGHSPDIGRPNLPVIRKVIQIPEDAVPSLEIDVKEEQMILKYPIIPVQAPVPKIEGVTAEFTIDRDFYKIDRFFPEKWVQIKKIGYLRGHRVLFLEIYPVKYNPRRNSIIYAKSINIAIRLNGSNMQKTESVLRKYYSHPYEQTSRKMITNFRDFEVKSPPEIPIGYLIITADDYYSSVLPLSEWKRKKGHFVTVTKTSDIPGGATAVNIMSYIQDAYDDTLGIPPTFVVLVGDKDEIPESGTGSETGGVTDLYYATTAGGDYIPDIYIGRFPVSTTDELDGMVEDIVDYERNLWTQGTDWLQKAYFMASDDETHHLEVETCCNICMEIARANGMICDSLYGFYGTGTSIADAINEGRVMAIYTGHGSTGGWDEPSFGQSDVINLFNYDKYPFVVSHACNTGDFSVSECFGETWVRVIDKGASGFFGSVPSSHWIHDDTLQIWWFKSMFGDSSTNFIGGFTQIGLFRHDEIWPGGGEANGRYYYEAYHIFGDPSQDIYTLVPKPIIVKYPAVIPTGDYSMEVSISESGFPVKDALVCALADSQFVGYTNPSGITTLNIKTTEPCTVWITVTGHNLATYEGFALAVEIGIENVYSFPLKYNLFPISPNLFSSFATIRYSIPNQEQVKIVVYNILGQEVVTLLNKEQKPGIYSIQWSTKNFTSGVYFIRLQAGNYVSTKKAIILR